MNVFWFWVVLIAVALVLMLPWISSITCRAVMMYEKYWRWVESTKFGGIK